MSLLSARQVKKLLELLLKQHHIGRRFPAYCLFDKKKNPVMKLTHKRFEKISPGLVEKKGVFVVSKKAILELHGGNILKIIYKEIRDAGKRENISNGRGDNHQERSS